MTSSPPGPREPDHETGLDDAADGVDDDGLDDDGEGGDLAGSDPLAGLGALFGPGGLGSVQDLLAQAQQMQSDLADTQRRLADTHVSGTSGGGLVRATVTGDRELVSLTIDPSVVDPAETDVLADLVVAAVRAANEHARVVAEQAMAQQVPELPDLSALGFGGPAGPAGADLPTGFGGLPPGLLGGAAGAGQDFGPSVPGGAAAASLPPVVPADNADGADGSDDADRSDGADEDPRSGGSGGRAPGV